MVHLHLSITWAFKVCVFAFAMPLQGEKCNSEDHKVCKRGMFQKLQIVVTLLLVIVTDIYWTNLLRTGVNASGKVHP